MKILIADKLPAFLPERLRERGHDVTVSPSLAGDALSAALAELAPEVLVVRSTEVRAPQLEAGAALGLVIRAGAGVNTIDLETASRRGVFVANCPGKNAVAVAELTLAHLLALDRRLPDNVAALREGRWAKKTLGSGRGLLGRTLAVIGAGAIAREVIARAKAFGMKVRVHSRSLTPEDAAALGAAWAGSVVDACRDADALTVHVALTPDTRGLIGEEALSALRAGAYVVNTARGGIVDEAALARHIAERGLRAGLDVYEHEPKGGEGAFDDAIGRDAGVYGTHHIGASTDQAEEAVAEEVARIISAYRRTGRPTSCVNLAEQTPATHMLVVRHEDRVGVLASVLETLRAAEVNVQEMENIVFSGAHAACARIQLDHAPGDDVVPALPAREHAFDVALVALGGA
ncbi:MAG: hydroxyacid dehydrogenase [Myxococcales bacterium]|nr:hydroxyacid dehydrogenase [Myxococcales bacterium]